MDTTPMIDVVLQLIIFFMFTSQFGQIADTRVELPQEPGEEIDATDRPTFVLDIDAAGELFLEGRPVTLDRFAALVAAEAERAGPENVTLLIRPDRRGAAATLNRVAGRLASVGVRRWSIGTAEPGGSP